MSQPELAGEGCAVLAKASPWWIEQGDVLELLKQLPDEAFQCCVTSPPYWGLRDYGPEGSLGLEATPEEYVDHLVAVFREVRRVLRSDGTLWLNLGDSYAGSGRGLYKDGTARNLSAKQLSNTGSILDLRRRLAGQAGGDRYWAQAPKGLKAKDLVGIPWMVAKALQAPYYTGRIRSEADRAWLAGYLEATTSVTTSAANTPNRSEVAKDARVLLQSPSPETIGRLAAAAADDETGRCLSSGGWELAPSAAALLLAELYPYLRTKRPQATLVWTLARLLSSEGEGPAVVERDKRAREIGCMLRALAAGGDVRLPAWVEEPASPTEPGWWLRADVIWAKPNPMPESVRDRPTKAHEYLFLFSKSRNYFYDAEAIAEPFASGGEQAGLLSGRNRRSVWQVTPERPPRGHHAVFPTKLVEPCLLAGTSSGGCCPLCGMPWKPTLRLRCAPAWPRPGGGRLLSSDVRDWNPTCRHESRPVPCLVLDPFVGSGTTVLVAARLGRRGLGIDLNADYVELARRRLRAAFPG